MNVSVFCCRCASWVDYNELHAAFLILEDSSAACCGTAVHWIYTPDEESLAVLHIRSRHTLICAEGALECHHESISAGAGFCADIWCAIAIGKFCCLRAEPLWMSNINHCMLCAHLFLCFLHLVGDSCKRFIPCDAFKLAFATLTYTLHRIKKTFRAVYCLLESRTLGAKLAVAALYSAVAFNLYNFAVLEVDVNKAGITAEAADTCLYFDSCFFAGNLSIYQSFKIDIFHKYSPVFRLIAYFHIYIVLLIPVFVNSFL